MRGPSSINAWAGFQHLVLAGVEKCGTTSIHAYLSQHPKITSPPGKELFFFSRNHDRGVDWYSGHFDLAPGNVALDATPSYFRSSEALDRLEAFPSSKYVIFVMRHPVRRAYSSYLHDINLVVSKGRRSHLKYRRTDFSFRQLFDERNDRYFTRYGDSVTSLRNRFSPERVRCFAFENVVADVPLFRDRIGDLLNMDLESLGSSLPWQNRQHVTRFLYPGDHRVFETDFGTLKLDPARVYRCEHGVPIAHVDIPAKRIDDVRDLEASYDLTIERSFCEEIHETHFRDDVRKVEALIELELPSWNEQSDLAAVWDHPLVHYQDAGSPHLALCTLAHAFMNQRQMTEARRVISKAIEIARDDPQVTACWDRFENEERAPNAARLRAVLRRLTRHWRRLSS